MILTTSLQSINDLFGKLEREEYRAYHARKEIHKADHFYNFCVTAHAMKDYFLEYKGLAEHKHKGRYHEMWNNDVFLIAVSEIANTAKHFMLRERRSSKPKELKTKGVEPKESCFVNVCIDDKGRLLEAFVIKPDLIVTFKDGKEFELWEFTKHVTDYWRTFLESEGVIVRRQSIKELLP